MLAWPLLLLLSLAACRPGVELALQVDQHCPGRDLEPLADLRVVAEDDRRTPVGEGWTDAQGLARIAVELTGRPLALTVVGPGEGVLTSLVGVWPSTGDQALTLPCEAEEVETVTVSGEVSPRAEGSTLHVVALAPGGTASHSSRDSYRVRVPLGQPATLQVTEYTTATDFSTLTRPTTGWQLFDLPPHEQAGSWDLELGEAQAPRQATLELLAHSEEESWRSTAHGEVLCGLGPSPPACGWAVFSELHGYTSYTQQLEWLSPQAPTATRVVLEDGSAGSWSSCLLHRPPDEVAGPVELLPYPVTEALLDPEGPVGLGGVPSTAHGTLRMVELYGRWTWTILGVAGRDALWLPTPLVEGVAAAYPEIVDGIAVVDPDRPDRCTSGSAPHYVHVGAR